jgi:hypothetical protein
MDFFDILSWCCGGVSVILFIYLLVDFFKVNKEYDEDYLTSSTEAADEIVEEERRLAREREAKAREGAQ